MAILQRRQVLAAGLATILSPRLSRATSFPERPVRVIVPYGAGGAGDTTMRLLASQMEAALGKPIVIESMAGAGGNLGAQAVLRAEPDGHTLLLGATNNFVINQFLFKNMAFDPLLAFAPVTRVANIPSVLFSNPKVPAATLVEFLDHARKNPGKLNYGSPSPGTTPHLSVERLKQLTGIDIVHVPYRGAASAIQGLVTNEIQLYLGGVTLGSGFLESGTLRALSVATERRLETLPNVPTAIESGVPGYTANNWWGLAAPRGTPSSVIETIYSAVQRALGDETVRRRFAELGQIPGGERPEVFAASMGREAAEWEETVRRGNLQMD